MMIYRVLSLFVLFCLCFIAFGNELTDFIEIGERNNPELQAFREKVRQAGASRAKIEGDMDPRVYAGAGAGRDIQGIPAGQDYESAGGDVAKVEGGVTVPVEGFGSYISAGGTARRVFDSDDYDRYYQASSGVRIEVPLLKDRGFALLDFKRQIAVADFNLAMGNYATAAQRLRHNIEQSYITAYETRKAFENAREATGRFLKFQADAAKMVNLKAIAEYQLFNADLELQLGRENEEIAANNFRVKILELENYVCLESELKLGLGIDCLIEEAEKVKELPEVPDAMDFKHRGEVLVLLAEMDSARAQVEKLREEGKDELSLDAGVSWNSEGNNTPFDMKRISSENRVGGEAMLVWRRTLGKRSNEAEIDRLLAYLQEKEATLQHTRNRLLMELRMAEDNFDAARRRFNILRQGVEAARKTVEAERNRFNQGEGTSNDVLDAQKKLTDILQRLNTAAADLLRAESDFGYATGYEIR